MNSDSGWNTNGIPNEDVFETLLYNRAANALIAQFRHKSRIGAPVATLYVRQASDSEYRYLTAPSDSLSYEDVLSAPAAPVIITNVMDWNAHGTAEWFGVNRIDLSGGSVISTLRPGEIRLESPYVDGWVKAIHASCDTGQEVFCTIALIRPATANDPQPFAARGALVQAVADAWLCELNLIEKRYTKIIKLLTPFF